MERGGGTFSVAGSPSAGLGCIAGAERSTAVQSCWTWVKGVYSSYTLSVQKRNTSMPIEVKPAVSARVQAYSRPTGAYPADHDTMAVVTATKDTASCHADARKAVSAVIAPSLALPRIPSVPKYLRNHKVDYPVVGRLKGHACRTANIEKYPECAVNDSAVSFSAANTASPSRKAWLVWRDEVSSTCGGGKLCSECRGPDIPDHGL